MTNSGDQTLGGYQLRAILGRGGMATVYRAFQPSLNREVVVKTISLNLATDDTFLLRFRREATVVAALKHPNIVPVYDFGEQDGVLYIVMMFVEGGTLASRIGSLPLSTILTVSSQAASALDYAHRNGVVHRDVKPSNILMGGADWALLSDFGIASFSEDERLTRTGMTIGTATYMSPEQGQGLATDGRSDLYSLGVVLYELLTGTPPYRASTTFGLIQQHLSAPIPSAREVRPDLPIALDDVVTRLLAKWPAARYQSGAELKSVLDDVRMSLGKAAQSMITVTPPTLLAPANATSSRESDLPTQEVIPPNDELSDGAALSLQAATELNRRPESLAPTSALERKSTPRSADRSADTMAASTGLRRNVGGANRGLVAVAVAAVMISALAVTVVFAYRGGTQDRRGNSTANETTTAFQGVSLTGDSQSPTPSEQTSTSTAASTPSQMATVSSVPDIRTVAPSSTAIAGGTTGAAAFEESFVNPKPDGWTGARENVFVDGGQLHVVGTQPNIFYQTSPSSRPRYANFRYQADLTFVSGNGVIGMFFRDRGDFTNYRFYLTSAGQYGLDRIVGGRFDRTLVGPASSPAIRTGNGPNTLAVETAGNRIKLLANDQLLVELNDDLSESGYFGLGAFYQTHVAVSHVLVEPR